MKTTAKTIVQFLVSSKDRAHQCTMRSPQILMASDDYSLIAFGLAQGSAPDDFAASFEAFDTIVLCSSEFQPEVIFPDDKSKRILRCPFDDSDLALTPVQVERLKAAARQIVEEHEEERRILITCFAGINRSGLLMGMVLKERFGITGEEAIRWIRKKRYGSLSNRSFCRHLIYSAGL
jgi:hypothetical protein